MTKRLTRWIRVGLAVYLIAVFVLCLGKFGASTPSNLSLWGIPGDKVAHFLLFLPFPFLMFFSLGGKQLKRKHRPWALLCVLVSGLLLAVATETAQHFLNYRSGEWADLAADALGLLFSTLILIPAVCLKD